MVQTYQKQNILRRGVKNTQKNCTKKNLKDPDNHNDVITHLESDILECEVKGALGSITLVLAQVNKNNINKIQHPLSTRHILNALYILSHFSLTMACDFLCLSFTDKNTKAPDS